MEVESCSQASIIGLNYGLEANRWRVTSHMKQPFNHADKMDSEPVLKKTFKWLVLGIRWNTKIFYTSGERHMIHVLSIQYGSQMHMSTLNLVVHVSQIRMYTLIASTAL